MNIFSSLPLVADCSMDFPELNSLAGLPDEDILARVSFRSVCGSTCVAQAGRELIDDSLGRGRLPQTLEPLDIGRRFPFLNKLPEIEGLRLVDSCNGLFLFERYPKSKILDVLGYIVCNPATNHWATVPVCVCTPPSKYLLDSDACLVFDPAASPHFHLVHFWKGAWGDDDPLVMIRKVMMSPLTVHTYSSETRVWSHSQTDWNEQGQLEGWRRESSLAYGFDQQTLVNGILHLRVKDSEGGDQIVAVDVQGRTKKTIKMPAAAQGRRWHSVPYIGQSQGRLHYINRDLDAHSSGRVQGYELFIWVLQDYDRQEWVLKDAVSFLRLFGRMAVGLFDFNIITIQTDRSVVFFCQRWNRLVIAYDMDSKEVSVVATRNVDSMWRIVPYIPYFSESPALTNKN